MPDEQLNVDPEALRTHAVSVQRLMDRTTEVLEAATYIAAADDGYGAIPRPWILLLLEDNHNGAVAAIRKLAEEVATVPGKLIANADSFEGKDNDLAKSLQDLRDAIAESSGGQ